MWFRRLPLLALLLVAACGSQLSAGIEDGNYSGIDSGGREVDVSIDGGGAFVTVNGTRADPDQTAQDLTFDVDDSTHAHWVCVPIDQGMRCRVTLHRRRQTIELTQV